MTRNPSAVAPPEQFQTAVSSHLMGHHGILSANIDLSGDTLTVDLPQGTRIPDEFRPPVRCNGNAYTFTRTGHTQTTDHDGMPVNRYTFTVEATP